MFAFSLAAICLFIVYRLVPVLCTSFVAIVATMIGIALALRAHRLCRIVLAMRDDRSAFPRRPSRAEHRAMALSLHIALRRTELRSLFPMVADRAEHLAMKIEF